MLSNGREPLMGDVAGRGADTRRGTQFFNLLPASLPARHWAPAAAPPESPSSARAPSAGIPPPRNVALELSPPEAGSLECPEELGLQRVFIQFAPGSSPAQVREEAWSRSESSGPSVRCSEGAGSSLVPPFCQQRLGCASVLLRRSRSLQGGLHWAPLPWESCRALNSQGFSPSGPAK